MKRTACPTLFASRDISKFCDKRPLPLAHAINNFPSPWKTAALNVYKCFSLTGGRVRSHAGVYCRCRTSSSPSPPSSGTRFRIVCGSKQRKRAHRTACGALVVSHRFNIDFRQIKYTTHTRGVRNQSTVLLHKPCVAGACNTVSTPLSGHLIAHIFMMGQYAPRCE